MKIDEMKLRIINFADNTIDLYIPPTGFLDKMKNSTIKLWAHQNAWRLNKILDAFKDENGEIDPHNVLDCYENCLFENGEFRLDIRKMMPEEYSSIISMLPNKIVLFRKEDLHKLLNIE